ncbi:hypothetical protein ACN08Z_04825 [Rothia sp. P7181]|uniref:hypothetical protein n=1 Tax=unclassified Rothia (in: high G+C Gram-positive bacteria) TaxID=2689056 RepID=UPI003ABE2608
MTDYALGDRGTVEVITHDFYDAEILQVFEELQMDRERVWNGQARLVPEPDNPYEPGSIAVYVDELKIGRLHPQDSKSYWNPITRVIASGYDAVAHLQLSAVARRKSGHNMIESSGILSLSAPGSLFPLNNAPTQATLLPQGPSMKVLDEKNHAEYLHSILPPSGEGRVILTLEANRLRQGDGNFIDSVEVFHDRKKVGRLSTQMSEQLAPVIRYAFEKNKLTSAWGTIRGNSFELSLTVQAVRAEDLPSEWYEELPNNVPELLDPADDYEVTTVYVPTQGEIDAQTPQRKKRSGFVSPFSSSRHHSDEESVEEHDTLAELNPNRRVSILMGIVGAAVLLFGVVLVFSYPMLGLISIVLGFSLALLGLFMGRTPEDDESYEHYDEDDVEEHEK